MPGGEGSERSRRLQEPPQVGKFFSGCDAATRETVQEIFEFGERDDWDPHAFAREFEGMPGELSAGAGFIDASSRRESSHSCRPRLAHRATRDSIEERRPLEIECGFLAMTVGDQLLKERAGC